MKPSVATEYGCLALAVGQGIIPQAKPCRDAVKLLLSISTWHWCISLVDVPAHPGSGDMPWASHPLWLLGGAILLHTSKAVVPTWCIYRWSETSLSLPGCNKTQRKRVFCNKKVVCLGQMGSEGGISADIMTVELSRNSRSSWVCRIGEDFVSKQVVYF